MPDDFHYDVFLSYCAKDRAVVSTLAERLKQCGLEVWFDEWVIKPGHSIPAKIQEGLESSRVLILCMSANAYGSEWTQLESFTFRFRDPLNHSRRFIPVRLDSSPIRESLAQFLHIDWVSGDCSRLVDACRAVIKENRADLATSTKVSTTGRSALFDSLPAPLCVVNFDGVIRYTNPALRTLLSLGSENLAGTTLWDYVSENNREAVLELCSEIQEGETRSLIANLIRGDGAYFAVTARFTRDVPSLKDDFRTSERAVDRPIIITFDRISNELALTSLVTHWDKSLLSVFDDFPLRVFVKDPEKRYIYANKALLHVWDFAGVAQLHGMSDLKFFPTDHGGRYHMDDDFVLRNSKSMLCAEMHWHPEPAQHLQVMTLKIPVRDIEFAGSRPVGVLGICWEDSDCSDAIRQIYDLFVREYLSKSTSGTIKRSIQFAPEYYQAGVTVLAYFGEIVREKYPGKKVLVSIKQEGRTVTLEIETSEGMREEIEATLNEYGEVIIGGRKPEDFLQNELSVVRLKNKLALANAEIEMNINLLNALSAKAQSLEDKLAERNAVLAELFLQDRHKKLLMSAPEYECLFIVFLDLVSSSSLSSKEKIAANSSLQIFANAFGLSCNARHANTWGDAVVACFRSIKEAVGFAVRILAALKLDGLHARVGINFGPVTVILNQLLNKSDVCSPVVDFAARLEQCAETDEILISSEVARHSDAESMQTCFSLVKRRLRKSWGDLLEGSFVECFTLDPKVLDHLTDV